MQPKRRRLEQPFREAPSRGYTYSQGRGGGVSTYKQTKQGPRRGAGGSGFRIPKKNRTGDTRYGSKTRHTSSIGTNNKNVEIEQTACLSKSDRIQRNSSKQHSPRGKVDTFFRELEVDNKRHKLIGEYFRVPDRVSGKTSSSKFKISNSSVKVGKKDFEFRNRRDEIKTGSGVCSISDKRSVCQSFVCTPQERWGDETNLQPEKPEPVCNLQSLQNGRLSGCEKSHTRGGLVMQGRSKGCILLHTNSPRSQKISEIHSRRPDAAVPKSTLRTGIRSTTFHKNNETSHCSTATHRSPPCDILRRHIVAKSITRWAAKRQRHLVVAPPQSRLAHKLEKISFRSKSTFGILRSYNRLNKNGDNSFRNKSSRHKAKMFKSIRQGNSFNSRISKFNRYIKCHSRGSDPGIPVCKGTTNVPDQVSSEITEELSDNGCSSQSVRRGDNLVDPPTGPMERETNSNVGESRSDNRDGCIKDRLGSSLSGSLSNHGRTVECVGETTAHQCTRNEGSSICSSSHDKGKQKYSCAYKVGQQNDSGSSKQDGGDPFRSITENNKRDMVVMPIQADHAYCRVSPRETEHSGRLGEPTHERLKQLDAESRDLQSNQSKMGPTRSGPICRSPKHSTTTIHKLVSRPTSDGNRCIPDKMAKGKRVCIPPFLSDNKMLSKTAEGKGRDCNNISSMANSAILSNAPGTINRQSDVITSTSRSADIIGGSDAPTNTNQYTEISGMESFRRIKEAAGVSKQTSELLAAGWRKGTQTAYNSCWRQWSSWCHTRQADPFHTSVENIADFLAELYARGYEYRTINNYRSAISALHAEMEGKKVGKHELICQLMTGIFNKNPPTPRYTQMWDVNKVLSYIISMKNDQDLSLKEITLKLCMLMALASASRSSEIHKLDIGNMSFCSEKIVFTLSKLTKSRQVGQNAISIEFDKYEGNEKLDIVACTTAYLEKTKDLRGDETQFFVSYIKPHKAVKSCTIANWLKSLMEMAGIDISIFKPHSTRGAGTSKANKYGLSIDQIISKGNWKSCKTFQKFYNRPVNAEKDTYQNCVFNL